MYMFIGLPAAAPSLGHSGSIVLCIGHAGMLMVCLPSEFVCSLRGQHL